MARVRSPNYPAIGLPEAIKRVEQVFAKEHRHAAPRDVVVKRMGFGGVNGTSLGAISAVTKYGLLDRNGDQYRVSDRALAILHPSSPTEKAKALKDAARSPELFTDIILDFPGAFPSDDNLRSWLIRRGFSQSSLGPVVQAFRETMELAPQALLEQDSGSQGPEPEPSNVTQTQQSPPAVPSRVAPTGSGGPSRIFGKPPPAPIGDSAPRATLPLPEGIAAFELPDGLSKESLEDVRDWIDVMLRRAERAVERAQRESAERSADDRPQPDHNSDAHS